MSFLPLRLLNLALLCLATSAGASAADFFLTPQGAGTQDGTSWEQALPQTALAATVNERMQPGDRLLLGSGVYADAALKITRGGSAGKPKVLEGVDRGGGLPLFAAGWSIERPDKGPTAVQIEAGVSQVTLRALRIKGYCFGVRAPATDAARSHLVFDDLDMEQIRHGFYLADCDDLQLTRCDLKRYSKHGFRFDAGCDRVTVRACTADCSEGDAEWELKTELLPYGFNVDDSGTPNTALRFEDCVARNHMKPNQTSRYTNGDGFVVEGNARDVSFIRCRALRNQDGGFDLKVPAVQLTACVAIGNRRDFRLWAGGTLTHCFAGWSSTGVWSNGAAVTATRCTFHEHSGGAAMADDQATAPVTLADCLVTATGAAPKAEAGGRLVELKNTVVATPKNPGKDPSYPRPDARWDGLGDAMDSRAYPDKGYRSKR